MSLNKDLETERRANAECLLLELSGKTWYVPFEILDAVPRIGEKVQVADNCGRVAEIEYEFTEVGPPTRMDGEEMPGGRSYARPVRVVIRAS